MDATGISLPSPRQARSACTYYVDSAQDHTTGNDPLVRRIQAAPMRVKFKDNDKLKMEVKTWSLDEMDRVVDYMNDGLHDSVAARQARSPAQSPHS